MKRLARTVGFRPRLQVTQPAPMRLQWRQNGDRMTASTTAHGMGWKWLFQRSLGKETAHLRVSASQKDSILSRCGGGTLSTDSNAV